MGKSLKKRTALYSCGLLLLFVAIGIPASEDREAKQRAYGEDFMKIEEAGKQEDRSSLINISKQLETRWRGEDIGKYARLMNKILAVLRNDFKEVNRAEIARLANEAIRSVDRQSGGKIPPDALPAYWQLQDWYLSAQYRFYYYERGIESHDDSLWREQRLDVASRTVGTLERIEKVMDPNWKKDVALRLQAEPPKGMSSGIGPEAVKDPNVRAEYEKRIEENTRKNEWWKVQRDLRDLQGRLLKKVRSAIPAMYSRPPYDDEQLAQLLTEHMKDAAIRNEMLAAIQHRKTEPAQN